MPTPFVTEEIYHHLDNRKDDLCVKQFTAIFSPDKNILEQGILLKEIISALRDSKNKHKVKPKEPVQLYIQSSTPDNYTLIKELLAKQVNAQSITFTNEAVAGAIAVVVGTDKFYMETAQPVANVNQKEELQKELAHLKGFLLSVDKKLSNERFVQNAKPEVIALEQKKKEDAMAKIKVIEESLYTK